MFFAQIPLKYRQKRTEKHILIIQRNSQDLKEKKFPEGIKNGFAPRRPIAFKISENDFRYFFFKSTKFHLSTCTVRKVTKD